MGNAYLGKGYNYQDYLTTAIILQYLIQSDYCDFWFDKRVDSDFFDDFKVINDKLNIHFQIKYSDIDAEIKQTDFLKDNQLSLHNIAESVNNLNLRFSETENVFIIALKRNNKEIADLLQKVQENFITSISGLEYYKISYDYLQNILNDSFSKSDILNVYDHVYFSFGFPEFSQQTFSPGTLESILLSLAKRLGVGEFPNSDKLPEYFLDNLVGYVKSMRNDTSKNKTAKICTTEDIVKYTRLTTDYGKLGHLFSIDENTYVNRNTDIKLIIDTIRSDSKSILTGSPGSGKSYLMHGVINSLIDNGLNYLKYHCYLGYDEKTSDLRVQSNNLIGNISIDILEMYPELRQYKETTYGATINDLNNLIINLPRETYLIIDGIDHAYRSYKKDERNLKYDDYNLVDIVAKLKTNPNLHLLVISQDICEIEALLQQGYLKLQIPDLSIEDSREIANKTSQQLIEQNLEPNILSYIIERASGNALILSYLTRYVILNDIEKIEDLSKIPDYNGNLEDYYTQLNVNGSSLDIVCYLAISECPLSFEEVTGISGKILDNEFRDIKPYILENKTAGGFYFFHESFKRFLLEKVIVERYNLIKYRNDIINYWMQKDPIEYEKRYRFLYRLMFLNERYNEIYSDFDFNYLVRSKIAGYVNEDIRENLNYIKMASLLEKNYYVFSMSLQSIKIVDKDFGQDIIELYPKEYYSIILKLNINKNFMQRYLVNLSDVNAYLNSLKILDSTHVYNWSELSRLYFEAANDCNKIYLLIKTGILSKKYVCDWKLSEKEILQSYLVIKENLGKNNIVDFIEIQKKPNFIMLALVNNAIDFDNRIGIKSKNKINLFEHQDYSISILKFISLDNTSYLTENSKNLLEYRWDNWFYMQFLRFAEEIHNNKGAFGDDSDISELYLLFSNVNEPFIGKPRVPDIHDNMGIYSYLILLPLSAVSNKKIFIDILKSIISLSEDINSTLQGVEFNPISLSKLIKWIPQFFNETQKRWIVELLNVKIESNLGYVVYDQSVLEVISLSDITSSYDKTISFGYFDKAVKLSFGYGYHKDRTLSDILDSYPFTFAEDGNMEFIKKMHFMAQELQYVTDRKDTSHYPVEWVKSISKSDINLILDYIAYRYETIDETGYTEEMHKALFEEGFFDNVVDSLYISLVGRTCCLESRLFIDKMITKISAIKQGTFRKKLIKMLSHTGFKKLQEYKPFEVLKNLLSEINVVIEPFIEENVYSQPKEEDKVECVIKSEEDIDRYFNRSLWSRDALEKNEIEEIISGFEIPMKQYFLIKYYMHQADGWGRIFVHEEVLVWAYEIDKENFDNIFHNLFVQRINSVEYLALSIPYLIKSFNVIPQYREFAKHMWLGAYNIIKQRIPEFKENNDVNDFFKVGKRTKNPTSNLSKVLNKKFAEPFFA